MKKSLIFAAVGLMSLSITSCLKDKGYDAGTTGHDLSSVPKIIELAYPNQTAKQKAYAFDFEDAPITQTVVYVRLAAAAPATEDITVKLDTAGSYEALRGFNADAVDDGSLVVLPPSFYTLAVPSLSYTIQKGQIEVPVIINTNSIQFDPSTTYGLAFKLVSVDKPGYNLSGNYGSYIATFGAKNKYDGEYSLNSYHNRPGYQLWVTNEPMHLVTTGGSEVAFFWPRAGSVGHPIMSPTGISWYGATVAPRIVFDASTNLVSNVYGSDAAGPPIDLIAPGTYPTVGISRYDESSKRVYVYFRYNANNERGFLDTLTYVGPR